MPGDNTALAKVETGGCRQHSAPEAVLNSGEPKRAPAKAASQMVKKVRIG